MVKKSLVIWRNSSSEFERSKHLEEASMLAIKDDDEVFDIVFAFMEKSNDEAEDEVTLHDLKDNLDLGIIKKLRKLACALIDSLHYLTT